LRKEVIMSFQNDVPIVQKVYDFYKELYSIIEKMPKKDKYTLGVKLQKTTLDLIELLIGASYSDKENKTKYLAEANIKLDLLKLLVRLAQDIKALPTTKYLKLEEKLQEIGRMLGGWIKSVK